MGVDTGGGGGGVGGGVEVVGVGMALRAETSQIFTLYTDYSQCC